MLETIDFFLEILQYALILKNLTQDWLKIVAMKMVQVDRELAETHYDVHRERSFFPKLIDYIISSPVVVIALEGKNAIKAARQTIGATNPLEATAGTIRGDFGLEIGRNLVHGSDSVENGKKELALWFSENDFAPHTRVTEPWIYE